MNTPTSVGWLKERESGMSLDDSIFDYKPKVIVRFSKDFMATNQVHYASDVSGWKKVVLKLQDGETVESLYMNGGFSFRRMSGTVERAIQWLQENIEGQFYIKEIGDQEDKVLVGFEDEDEAFYFGIAFR